MTSDLMMSDNIVKYVCAISIMQYTFHQKDYALDYIYIYIYIVGSHNQSNIFIYHHKLF